MPIVSFNVRIGTTSKFDSLPKEKQEAIEKLLKEDLEVETAINDSLSEYSDFSRIVGGDLKPWDFLSIDVDKTE